MSTITLDQGGVRESLTREQIAHKIESDFLSFISDSKYDPDDRDRGIVMWLRANGDTATLEDNSAIINFFLNRDKLYSDNEAAELMNANVSVEDIRAWVKHCININSEGTASNVLVYSKISEDDKISMIKENLNYFPNEELGFMWACVPAARRMIVSHAILNNSMDVVFSKTHRYYNELHRNIENMDEFIALSDVSDEVELGVYI